MNERIELPVLCKPNYYLVGSVRIDCRKNQTSCHFRNCSVDGSASQECENQNGKCSCNGTSYGDECENRDCTLSSWGPGPFALADMRIGHG